MTQVSKVEKPQQNPPPPADVLARQIKALENDIPPEKRETIAPRLKKLEGRIHIVSQSREKSAEELAEINRELSAINSELEQIRNELEIKLFTERFRISEAVAKFLLNNPDKKITDLKPSDFKNIPELQAHPELQEPEAWQNILEDAQKGMAVAELLQKKDFDWKDPKAYLEKAGDLGKEVWDTAKKNPYLFGGCLLLGGIALYQFLKKNKDLKDVIIGAAAGSASVYLGVSLFSENLTSSLVASLGKKIFGDKWAGIEKFFGVQKKKGETQTAEDAEKYGDSVPLKEAVHNYWQEARVGLSPLVEFFKTNKAALTYLSVAGFAGLESFRALVMGTGKLTVESALGLSKLPFKIIGNYPLTTLFATTAVLLNLETIKGKFQEIRIPKDSAAAAKFLQAKMKEAGDLLPDMEIPHLSEAHAATTAEILTGTKRLSQIIPPTNELISGMAEEIAKMAELTPEKKIRESNLTGLSSFEEKIIQLGGGQPSSENLSALSAIKALVVKIKAGEKIDLKEMENLRVVLKPLKIDLKTEDGRIIASYHDENGFVRFRSICIDPASSEKEQFEAAKRFSVEKDDVYQAGGKIIEVPVDQLRLALGALREDVTTVKQGREVIERKLKEGWYITAVGGILSLIGKAGEKYILGGWDMIWYSNLLPGGKEFSCVEMAYEYAEGILPIMIVGTASAIARGDWRAFYPNRILFRTAFYPIVGAKKIASHILRPISDGNPKAIFTNPKIEFTSAFGEFIHANKARFSWILRFYNPGLSRSISAIHREIRDLEHAKKLLAQANGSFGRKRESLLNQVWELEKLRVRDIVLGGKITLAEFGKNHQNIEDGIQKLEEIIKEKKAEIARIRGKSPGVTPRAETNPNPPENSNVINLAERRRQKETTHAAEAAAENARALDGEILTKVKESNAKIRELLKKAIAEGRSVRDPELRVQIRNIAKEKLATITPLYARRAELVKDLPEEILRKFKLHTPEVHIGVPGHPRLKKFGKGLFGIAATMAAMYGMGELVAWASEEGEQLVVDDLTKGDKRETVGENKESMRAVINYFGTVNQEYDELFAEFSPENLKKWDEVTVRQKIEVAAARHKKNLDEILEFVKINQAAIREFYKNFQDKMKQKIIGRIFTLKFENEKVVLDYATENDFRSQLYEKIDYAKKNLDDLLAGHAPSSWTEIGNAAMYMIPVYGTYRDATDAWKHFERGNLKDGMISGAWAVVGGVSDVLLIFGVGAGLRAATTAARVAKIARVGEVARVGGEVTQVGKLARVGEIARTLGSAKVQLGMSGADLIRPLFVPKLSGKLSIAAH